MDTLTINGGTPLYGELTVGGSKNAVLPVLAACLLTDEEVIIHNAPMITDIDDMLFIMSDLGVKSRRESNTLIIDSSGLANCEISDSHVGKIRSSVILLGAVLARLKKARLAETGGCDIGSRPIDMHLSAFMKMGISIDYDGDCWCCNAEKITGTEIVLPFPSVGTTENIILAASMASGTTIIENAAREPEIEALQNFINSMGGSISGAGTGTVIIEGKKKYHGTSYSVIPDRIVAGTYMLAAAAAGGDVLVKNAVIRHNNSLNGILEACGIKLLPDTLGIRVTSTGKYKATDIVSTAPFPGFPTDLQPQLMAFLSKADGTSVIKENIYENRFKAAYSLCALGADIHIIIPDDMKNSAVIKGVPSLYGAEIYGTDLRCNAALVIAGLCAQGTTTIRQAHFIERGYENIIPAFRSVGADIS